MNNRTFITLEEEIKQKRSFKNVHEKSLVNLLYTHNWVMEQMRQFFGRYGLTLKQYNILRILRGAKGPLSTSQIRDRMLDKMSDTTRLIDRMVKKGWVEKNVCAHDRRLVDIVITDDGLSLLDLIQDMGQQSEDIFKNLDISEVEQLSYLLDKMRYR